MDLLKKIWFYLSTTKILMGDTLLQSEFIACFIFSEASCASSL